MHKHYDESDVTDMKYINVIHKMLSRKFLLTRSHVTDMKYINVIHKMLSRKFLLTRSPSHK
jgi:hypothetical protein